MLQQTSPTNVIAKIYLNEKRRRGREPQPYEDGDRLTQAIEVELVDVIPKDGQGLSQTIAVLLHTIQYGLTIPASDPFVADIGWILAYREMNGPDLAVGDVIQVGETAYAIEDNGWRSVVLHQERITIPEVATHNIMTREEWEGRVR